MAWTGDMNKYGLKYEILYPNEVWKDVSCLVSSPKMTVTENLFSSSFKSVISTTKLDLRYNNDTQKDLQQEIFSKMMEAKANFDRIGFRIKETATGKFPMNGFIDLSNITMVVGRLPRELSIEVENLITALDDDIQGSFQYPDIPVFDEQGKMNEGYCVYNPNDSANSIIPLLIMRCGLNITDLDMVHSVEILEKVPRIVYDADANTRTYRDLIDTLLYEHCAVLRQSDNGKLVISSFTYEKPEALREIAYTTENGLTMKGGDWQKDGWKIEWSTVDAVRQATVYQASITPKYDDKGEVLDSGEEIEALGYFPETGDLEPEYYEFDAKFLDRPYYTKQSRLKNKDLSLITTSNVTYELEADDRIEEVVAVRELHPLKARILLHNSDSDDVHFIRMFNMLGDCLFRKKINTYTYPEDAKKTEEYTTEFVTDEKVVNKLGSTLTSLSTHGDNTYSWTEFGQRGTVGDIVQITAPGTNISSLAVITSVSCSKANTDVWRNEYKAIGLVAYNALEPRKRSVVSGASSVEGKQGAPGNIKVEQYAIGDAIAPFTTAPEGSQSPETSMFLYNIGGEGYVLGGSDWELGEDSSWSTDIPTPSEGEYVWLRVGFYTPPALFPTVWQVTRLTGLVGASAKEVTIISTSDTLPTTSRGVPKIATIKFTALLKNMAITYASDISWTCSDPAVTLVPVAGDIHSVLLYTSEVGTDSFYVTATIETVVGQKAIARVADGLPAPVYVGVKDTVPQDIDGEPLIKGDLFLYIPQDTSDDLYGHVMKYDGENWVSATDSYSIGVAAKDAFKIARETGRVIYAAVIYTEAMVAANIQAGSGTGVAGSGFRFRAMDDDYSLEGSPKVPVFDVMDGDEVLFKVVASGTDKGDVIIGDYAGGNGIKYDKSVGTLSMSGSIEDTDGDYNLKINKTDGIKQTYSGIKTFHAMPNGDVMMGNYDVGTNDSGILYDASLDKMYGNFAEIRNVLPFQFEDSLDSAHPFEVDFFIPSDTVRIASVKLNAKGVKYRAYSTSIPLREIWENTTDSADSHTHSLVASNYDGTTSSVNNHSHGYTQATGIGGYNSGSHSHGLSTSDYGSTGSSQAGGDYHSHTVQVVTGITGNGAHEHALSTSGANTGGAGGHSHTYSKAGSIGSAGAHSHKFNMNHGHDLSFGIFEGTIPSSVNLYCDNGAGYGGAISLGSSANLASELDLSAYFSGTGWKKMKFTSSRLGRIVAQLILQVDITV